MFLNFKQLSNFYQTFKHDFLVVLSIPFMYPCNSKSSPRFWFALEACCLFAMEFPIWVSGPANAHRNFSLSAIYQILYQIRPWLPCFFLLPPYPLGRSWEVDKMGHRLSRLTEIGKTGTPAQCSSPLPGEHLGVPTWQSLTEWKHVETMSH
jgi:hypothetical protein